MENAETILVVILSAFLAISLLLSIVLLIICIKIAIKVKRLTEKASELADKAGALGDFVAKAAKPLAIGRIIAQVFSHLRKDEPNSKRRNK